MSTTAVRQTTSPYPDHFVPQANFTFFYVRIGLQKAIYVETSFKHYRKKKRGTNSFLHFIILVYGKDYAHFNHIAVFASRMN